jgi:hypothetical protein
MIQQWCNYSNPVRCISVLISMFSPTLSGAFVNVPLVYLNTFRSPCLIANISLQGRHNGANVTDFSSEQQTAHIWCWRGRFVRQASLYLPFHATLWRANFSDIRKDRLSLICDSLSLFISKPSKPPKTQFLIPYTTSFFIFTHLFYIICRICNICICSISTGSRMSYAQWSNSYTFFIHINIILILVLGFYSGLFGRVRTVYIFSLCAVLLLSSRFTASE